MAWQTVSRKGEGKGWNQGVQDQLLQSMTAMQNSISQLAQSMNTRSPPGSKGQGKGQTSQGAGQGCIFFPRGKKESKPEAHGGTSRTNYRRDQMPEVPKHTHTTGPPEWSAARAAASFPRGMSPKHPPLRRVLARPV